MHNIMLDPLPEKWHGYPIDSDFQTGILISQCFNDATLTDTEKFCISTSLLFPGERPSNQECVEALMWFLNEFDNDNHAGDKRGKKKKEVQVMDFDVDQWRIYAAFRSQYNINLARESMHWFEFMGMLCNLSECSLTSVMNIRQKEIKSNMSTEEKAALRRSKKIFAIKPPEEEEETSPQEKQRVDDFMQYANYK